MFSHRYITHTHTHDRKTGERVVEGAGREETGKGGGEAKNREWKGLNIFKIHDTLGRNSEKSQHYV